MEVTFEIPIYKIREVSKYLIKLQKRASRADRAAVVFNFSFDDEVKEHRFHAENVEGEGDIITSYKYRVLRVNQDITVHEGWVPIAKLDLAEKQLRSYSTYNKEIETLGDKLWTKHCDHCGHNKIVHTAFVMQNGDKYMKVGKGCMKELAPLSAAQIAREFDIYALWADYLSMMTKVEGGEGGSRRGGGSGLSVEYVYDKSTVILAMRAALEVTKGWVTSRHSEGDRYGRGVELINRGSRTFDYIQGFLGKQLSMIPDQKYVDSVNSEIDLCLNKYSHLLGERIEDFKIFAAADKIRVIDVFLIKTIQGIVQREADKDRMRDSKFQGETGKKIPFTLELVSTKSGQGHFGTWHLWIFKDSNGNMFKKFGAVPDRFKVDGVYKFTAPIKGFETYDEIKYTVLGGPLSKFK